MDDANDTLVDLFGPPISVYTRRQAIEDGVLVDVSAAAAEAGIACPVAVTRTVWDRYVIPDAIVEKLGQCVAGRLWDLAFLLRQVARRVNSEAPEASFRVAFVVSGGKTETVTLKVVAGGGDDGELVLTVMLPDED